MKSTLRILVYLLVAILSTSCITSAIVSHSKKQVNNIGRKSVRLHGKTLQMINRHSALMVTDKNDVICIVTDFDDYYDGMTIKGRYRRWGTYEYLSIDRTIHRAPIFVREKDYHKYAIIAEELGATKVGPPDRSRPGPNVGI
jgi:hypothetical protein